jgi:threonyl-tRNA synthetase
MLVVGERERESGTVSLRHRTGEEIKGLPLDGVVAGLAGEIAERVGNLTVGRS